MEIWLENIQCWEPGKGFSVFLQKSPAINLTDMASAGRPAEIQVGPYKITLETTNQVNPTTEEVEVALKASGQPLNINLKHGHGKVFVHSPDVEVVVKSGPLGATSKAHGCFEVLW